MTLYILEAGDSHTSWIESGTMKGLSQKMLKENKRKTLRIKLMGAKEIL